MMGSLVKDGDSSARLNWKRRMVSWSNTAGGEESEEVWPMVERSLWMRYGCERRLVGWYTASMVLLLIFFDGADIQGDDLERNDTGEDDCAVDDFEDGHLEDDDLREDDIMDADGCRDRTSCWW